MIEKCRTIVGGRARSNRLVGDFPRGIEILLKKASVDSVFGQYLLQDPTGAARSIALDLTPVEKSILTNTSTSILQKMIASTRVPKQHVKTFQTARTAAILVLVLSSIVVIPDLAAAGSRESFAQTVEQEELARSRMTVVQEALEAYKNDHGTYPSTKAWFDVPGPLSDYAPQSDLYDPWKRKFHYKAVKENGEIVNYKLESSGLDAEFPDDNISCPITEDKHRFTGVSPMTILFPEEGQTITVDEISDGLLEIKADHDNEMVLVYWYLNGVSIGSTMKMHNLSAKPMPGENILILIDENEESTGIHFQLTEKDVMKYNDTFAKTTIENNIEAFEKLLRAGDDIDLPDEMGKTIMMSLASYGNTETVQLGLDAGSDVHIIDKYGRTVLMHAAGYNGNIETIKLLLNAGSDINAQSKAPGSGGLTALMYAAHSGKTEIVKFLLKAGADVNALDNSGTTVLSSAAHIGNTEIVQILLDADADINGRSLLAYTALMTAAQGFNRDHPEIVKILLNAGSDTNLRNKNGETALTIAIRGRSIVIESLIRNAGGIE
jgi:ankyrin repeat protein